MATIGLSGLFQTIVGGLNQATQVLAPTWAAAEAIFYDHDPEQPGTLGQTLDVPLPADFTYATTDVQSNDMNINEAAFSTVPIVLNRHVQNSYPIRTFDQFRTPLQIAQGFARSALVGMRNAINADITALATAGNFNVNAAVVCSGSSITTTQYTGALATLAGQKVPVENNPEDMTMLIHNVPYYTMQDPTTGTNGAAWSQAFIAGNRFAEKVRDTGQVPVAFGTSFRMDQQMPVSGSSPSQTFTGLLMHRWAIGCVTRPLASPPTADKVVETTYIPFGKFQLRVRKGYLYEKDAEVLSIDVAYGLKVVRPEMGIIFSVAQ